MIIRVHSWLSLIAFYSFQKYYSNIPFAIKYKIK